jgi:hypothetical protein
VHKFAEAVTLPESVRLKSQLGKKTTLTGVLFVVFLTHFLQGNAKIVLSNTYYLIL